VLDEFRYKYRLSTLLLSEVYKPYPKDPTAKVERNTQKLFAKHKTDLKSKLTPYHNKPPHPYGLFKIHKEDIPLRTKVGSNVSLCYALTFSS
jgi:hypothetical protein